MKKKIAKAENRDRQDKIRNLAIIGIVLVAILAFLFLAFGLLFGGNQASNPNSPAVSEQNRANFNELKLMSERIKNLEFMADYVVTFDPKIRNDTSLQKYYSKSGNFRIDITEGNVSIQMYKLGDSTYACSEVEGGMACYFVGSAEELGSGSVLDDIENNLGNYDISISEQRTILGIGAKCFSIKVNGSASPLGPGYPTLDQDSDMAIENCFSSDGVPLEASSAFSKMTITSLSRKVPEDAFKLPSEPIVIDEADAG